MNRHTHQIGDRVRVLHNIPLGNLIGTVKAILERPKYDVYEVELDGGGTDQLYAEQLERITDTPETDAVREMWFVTPNVELGDGRPIHGNVVDVEHARKLERQRDKARSDFNAVAEDACQLQDALGFPCETENAQEKAMERIRDLIAAEGELGDLKEFIRENVVDEIYGQNHGAAELIAKTRAMVSQHNASLSHGDGSATPLHKKS